MQLSGWGRFPKVDCALTRVRNRTEVATVVANRRSFIARGNGRSYGDAALNPDLTVDMRLCDRLLSFDPVAGIIECECGILLSDLIDFVVPKGWFVPVVPGTKFVTIGGMIAADVHGKNHHCRGSFGNHLLSVDLLLPDGTLVRCSPEAQPELFWATVGGMGLTGIILTAIFRLDRISTPLIRQQITRAGGLVEALNVLEENSAATYSVAWIDCHSSGKKLGRCVIFLGEHVESDDLPRERRAPALMLRRRRPLRVPADGPKLLLSRPTMRLLNKIYYGRQRPGMSIVDLDHFFFPLDGLDDWNRLYGTRGFFQYQLAVPKTHAAHVLRTVLDMASAQGEASFLAVLKQFGRGNRYLSFPMEGYTLALDFPVGPATLELAERLDAVVRESGGRVYLAKDARMRAAFLRQTYSEFDAFIELRQRIDPAQRMQSELSRRLML